MIEVYRKLYKNKFETEIAYYFFINVRGSKKYYQTIYECISDMGYQYSRYTVDLDVEIEHIGKIENIVYQYTPILFANISAKRRLSILTKFILYIISTVNKIPIYKIPKKVVYYNNGNEFVLSVNAFIKSAYELVPRFEKIYKEQ
jgi:hypothetical protein